MNEDYDARCQGGVGGLVVEPKIPFCNRRSAKGRNLHQLLSKYLQNNQDDSQEKFMKIIRNHEHISVNRGHSTLPFLIVTLKLHWLEPNSNLFYQVIEFLKA